MAEQIQSYHVPAADAGQRLDVFLARASGMSRARIQRLVADGQVLLDGRPVKASAAVAAGQRVRLAIPPPEPLALRPEPIPLEILFEDDDLLVLNKPAGLVVHPGAGRSTGTLVHALLAHCGRLPGIGGVERPGIVHRLDRETSGVMAVAKTEAAHRALSHQFKARIVRKRYLALAHGRIAAAEGRIEAPIGRREQDRTRMGVRQAGGREARTTYRVLGRLPEMTLLELGLETGRTHQIRVHLAYIGHPVVGDRVYGGRREARARSEGWPERQMLHAWRLAFHHPRTGERLEFTAPPPDDFARMAGEALAAIEASGERPRPGAAG
jgi:23S rRNA pseudouridine1911/1915/1917 synthase